MGRSPDCPRCGGAMTPKIIGEMQDKHLECSYCGCLLDVPDEFESATSKEEVLADGTVRRVQTSHRRRDLGGEMDSSAVIAKIPGLKQLEDKLANVSFENWQEGDRHCSRMLEAGKVVDQQVFASRREMELWMNERVGRASGVTEGLAVFGSAGMEVKVGEDGAIEICPGAGGKQHAATRVVTTQKTVKSESTLGKPDDSDPLGLPEGLSPSQARQFRENIERFSRHRQFAREKESNNILLLKWIFICIVAGILLVVVIGIFR